MGIEDESLLRGFLTETKVEIGKAASSVAVEIRKRASVGEVLTPLDGRGLDERIIFNLPVQEEGVPLLGYNANVTSAYVSLERSGDIWSDRVVIGVQPLSHPDDTELVSEMNASISSKGVATLGINNLLKGPSDGEDIAFTTAADSTPNTSLAMRTAARRGLLVAQFTLDALSQAQGINYSSTGRIRELQDKGNSDHQLGAIPITPLLLRRKQQ